MDSPNEDNLNVSSVSASDTDFITDLEGSKVTLTFAENDLQNFNACHSVLEWVHPNLPVCAVENPGINDSQDTAEIKGDVTVLDDGFKGFLQIPSLAIVIFLAEDEDSNNFNKAHESFQELPWIFHHSESLNRAMTKCVPANNLDYYRAGDTGPLCGIRQKPCGKQIVRLVRFINYPQWEDNVDLYSLILSQKPEVTKQDFCLFTTGQTEDYDVQFAIKRAPKGITCSPVKNVKLNFRINHPGHIVPLLPFVCNNVTTRHWQSTDFDGNAIVFEAQERPETPDLSDLVLLESIDSDSALSDSTINAYAPSSSDEKQHLKHNADLLGVQRGQVDGQESKEQYQEDITDHPNGLLQHPLSPKSSRNIQSQSQWSPVSQTDSGRFSHPSGQSTLLSSPYEHETTRKRETLNGSHCSSDLGFQDHCSSSESRLCDKDNSDVDGDEQQSDHSGPTNGHRQVSQHPRQYSHDLRQYSHDLRQFSQDHRQFSQDNRQFSQDHRQLCHDPRQFSQENRQFSLKARQFGQHPRQFSEEHRQFSQDHRRYSHDLQSYSDHGVSDGYASTCAYDDESELAYPNYVMTQKPRDLNGHNRQNMNPIKEHSGRKSNHIHEKDPKDILTNKNGFGAPSHNQDRLNPRTFSNSETSLESPQKLAFRKLKKYKEVQSKKETLDLFNVSSLQENKDTSRRSRRPNQNKPKLFPNELKSVSDYESVAGSETEYEQAYQSIERDLEIINNALYGKSSQGSIKLTNGHTKRSRHKELKVLDSVTDPAIRRHSKSSQDVPCIQGFYV